MNKVDRALEIKVIDWLQWNEFKDSMVSPSDAGMAALALELIGKRKSAYTEALEQCERLAATLDCVKENYYGSQCNCKPCKALAAYQKWKAK